MATVFTLISWLLLASFSTFIPQWNSTLVEDYVIGDFHHATRIMMGTQGVLYIIDADQNKIFGYSDVKQSPKCMGGFGWSAGSFDTPTGVASDGINIYVSDYGNHRIQRFDRNLNYISSLSTRDTSEVASRFGYPLDVALSELGDLFVLDGENIQVLKFNPAESYERSFGGINAGKGKLQNPIKLLATTSRIFVGERTRIVVFDYFGNYLGSIGDGVVSMLNGFTLLTNGFLAVSSDTMWWFSQDGDFQKSVPLTHLISGERIDRIQDVACRGDLLFILSPRKLHVFKMVD